MIISDFVNRTDQGTCECRNPNCLSHELVANRKAGIEPSMKPVPCDEGEIILCGFCSNEKEKRGPCKHLGERTNEREVCPSCNGHVEVYLFECSKFGRCTTIKSTEHWQCCRGCGDHEEREVSI
jgi:hypothetical protein